MGAPRDLIWSYVTPGSRPKSFKCSFCDKEMYGNPTVMKKHMLSENCKPPPDVRLNIKRAVDSKRPRESFSSQEASAGTACGAATASKRPSLGSGAAMSSTAGNTMANFVRTLSSKESRALDVKCARWVYRRALPLSVTSSPEFISFCRALNPAYTPPSRFSLADHLLKGEFKALSRVVNQFVSRATRDGDLVVGGDGWSDRLRNSIYNYIVFTPEALYMETKVWGESRHSAENTAEFFATRIEALGARNVVAFVSDTENKMKAVWDLLEARFPWILTIPCSGHCFDLLTADIAKHPDVAGILSFCNSMTQYFKNHSFPKAVLERCQMNEYKHTIQLQRPGDTRWKSQRTAAAVLLKTQGAMEKAVVDATFKRECLQSGSSEQRKAAMDAARAVKDDRNWEQLKMVVELLEPLAMSLDNAQSDGRGLAMVRSAFFRLRAHFSSFSYPLAAGRSLLRQHVLKCVVDREHYTLRPVHTLAYLLDPRYIDRPDQPDNAELARGLGLLLSMATAHDIKLALEAHKCNHEDDLPGDYEKPTEDNVMGEYTSYKAKMGGNLILPEVWTKDTTKDPLAWWKLWGASLPHLQAVAVKVMKMPVGFVAGERSFSNAANIQTKLRTRLSYSKLHMLLYVYYNSRVLPEIMDVAPDDAANDACLGSDTAQLDGVEDCDGEEEAVDLGTAANIFLADLDTDEPAVSGDASDDGSPLHPTQRSAS